MDYLNGLLAPLERKNGWTVAEQVGQLRPDRVQRLLDHSDWDADAVRDAVRDDVRDFVVESIGSRDAVLIGDDTGFLKKGYEVCRRPTPIPVPPTAQKTARSGPSWPTPQAGGGR